jgi:hypothetical protein
MIDAAHPTPHEGVLSSSALVSGSSRLANGTRPIWRSLVESAILIQKSPPECAIQPILVDITHGVALLLVMAFTTLCTLSIACVLVGSLLRPII